MNLKKQYLSLVLPAAVLFLAVGLAREMNLLRPGQFAAPPILPPVLFVLCAITAFAGPLACRTLFAHGVRARHQVSSQAFLSFQRRLLWISQMTPYLALVAVCCDFPRFHAAAMVLMALYATYYYFPSRRRIGFDRRIFRVAP